MTWNPDEAEISALFARYLISLDDEKLDDEWAAGVFTDDAVVEFPMSRHEGLEGLAAYHRSSLAAFEAHQHLGAPAAVTVDGDTARLRANIIATHVLRADEAGQDGGGTRLFSAGTLACGESCRSAQGWRLSRVSLRVLWTSGTPARTAAG